MATKSSLLPILSEYFDRDPVTAARALETMNLDEGIQLVQAVSPAMAVRLLSAVNDACAAALLEGLPKNSFDRIANKLEPQKGVSILLRIPEERRASFLELLSPQQKTHIQELLDYPEDSAGRVMSVDFTAFHPSIKVKQAVNKLRTLSKKGPPFSYIYVVDGENHLVGILNMRDMLLAEERQSLGDIMRKDVITVNCFDAVENITAILRDRKLFAIPVVDHENRLLGVVRTAQLLGDVQEAASGDIQKMFGASAHERAFSPMLQSLKTRLPWLHVNLATAFLAASVVSLFEDVIARITVLAVYLPVVAGQGGNAGAQSLAIVMRGLVMREIPPHKAKKLILKESCVGLINGVVIGIVTGLIAWLWQGNPFLGIVIGLGMIVNLTVAGCSGAMIPLAMKRLHLDPAQCSSIILTTITDVVGFFAFLGFAVLLQDFLV